MDSPLAGFQVLDISQGLAGPYCGLMLAQYGASVIKIEPPAGDWMRDIGRRFKDHTANSIANNRGKRGLAVNLKEPQGREIALQLAQRADVFIESFRPGVADRLGLGYGAVRALNESVVYVSVSGFGQTGPYADRPATDTVAQAFSGLMNVNRLGSGRPERLDMLPIDQVTGLYAYQATVTALLARSRTGAGCHLDVDLMSAAAAFQSPKFVEYHLEGAVPDPLIAPRGTFATADGYLTITGVKEEHFTKLCQAIDRTDLGQHPRFATAADRIANEAEINALVADILVRETTKEWVRRFDEHGVLHAKINDYGDYMGDPHVLMRGGVVWVEQANVGPAPIIGIPGVARHTNGPLTRAPSIGEHSREILAEIGLGAEEIDALVDQGVIKAGDR